jgi:hypothetical protein
MLADVMTKRLALDRHVKLLGMMGIREFTDTSPFSSGEERRNDGMHGKSQEPQVGVSNSGVSGDF